MPTATDVTYCKVKAAMKGQHLRLMQRSPHCRLKSIHCRLMPMRGQPHCPTEQKTHEEGEKSLSSLNHSNERAAVNTFTPS